MVALTWLVILPYGWRIRAMSLAVFIGGGLLLSSAATY